MKSQLHRLARLGISDDDAAIIGAMYGIRKRREGRVDVERMIGAAARLVEGISRVGPVIIATDDVQYIGSMERQIIGAALRGSDRTSCSRSQDAKRFPASFGLQTCASSSAA